MKETKKLRFFFFHRFGYFGNFAFGSPLRYRAKLGCWCVCPTREGVVAFAALPDTNAFAFDLDKAAVGTLVCLLEPSNNFDVAFAYCCTVSGP